MIYADKDRNITELIERLFHSGDSEAVCSQLQAFGTSALPHLIVALSDSRLDLNAPDEDTDANSETNSGEDDEDDDAPYTPAIAPFDCLCKVLQSADDPRAALALAPFVEHKRIHFRQKSACALGYLGIESSIAPMLLALDDQNDGVRFHAMLGIRNGLQERRWNQAFLNAMFPALTTLLDRPDSSGTGLPARLLLTIDRQRAVTAMLSHLYFTIANTQIYYILKALNERFIQVPLDMLLPLLTTARARSNRYRYALTFAEALKAYARNPDTAAADFIQAVIDGSCQSITDKQTNGLQGQTKHSAQERVAEAALEALSILSGIDDHRDAAFAALEEQDFQNLAKPLQLYLAVDFYDGEVNNGGHSQYFENGSSEYWREAVAGLRAIGAVKRLRILERAVGLFGPTGPSLDQDERNEQLEHFSEMQWNKLSVLDNRYFDCKESTANLLTRYAMNHRTLFMSKDGKPSRGRFELDGEPPDS